MNSSHNSRPLLETDSDKEDVNEDDMIANNQTMDEAGGSRMNRGYDSSDSDSMDHHEIESTTEECDDDLTNLFKPTNTVPNDRFSLNYMVFYLLGMTTMIPWNFFITAEDVSWITCIIKYSIAMSSWAFFPSLREYVLISIHLIIIYHVDCAFNKKCSKN